MRLIITRYLIRLMHLMKNSNWINRNIYLSLPLSLSLAYGSSNRRNFYEFLLGIPLLAIAFSRSRAEAEREETRSREVMYTRGDVSAWASTRVTRIGGGGGQRISLTMTMTTTRAGVFSALSAPRARPEVVRFPRFARRGEEERSLFSRRGETRASRKSPFVQRRLWVLDRDSD